MGANPTFMSWADAQPALASGAVDGQENPLEVFLAAKINTLGQKFVTKWNYSNDILLFAIAGAGVGELERGRPEDRARGRASTRPSSRPRWSASCSPRTSTRSLRSASTCTCRPPPRWRTGRSPTRRPYARWKAQTQPQLVSKIEEIVAKTRKA